jgi:hypothetical protein
MCVTSLQSSKQHALTKEPEYSIPHTPAAVSGRAIGSTTPEQDQSKTLSIDDELKQILKEENFKKILREFYS